MKRNMMDSWAKVGAKVICINDKPHPLSRWKDCPLVKGQVYTIAAIIPYKEPDPILSVGIRLVEVKDHGWGFIADRFRPVKTQEQDVAIFKSILTDTRIPEKV